MRSSESEHSTMGNRGNQKLFTILSGKSGSHHYYNFKISRSEQLYGELYGKFPVIWFSSQLFQNLSPAAEIFCIDVSRRQLQSAIKLGSKIFSKKYGYFTLHTKGSKLLLYATAPLCSALTYARRGAHRGKCNW